MSATAPAPTAPPAPASERRGLIERLASAFDDPILLKELRAAFRKRRFLALQTGLLAVLAAVLLGYMAYLASETGAKNPALIGSKTFLVFAKLELVLIFLLFPAFSCTSVTDERTGKTVDLLLTTKLSPFRIVRGKILAAFVYGLLFIVATLPVVALTFLYGGVTPGQIALTYGVMIVLALIVTVFGVAISTVGGSTFQAVFRTYAGSAILLFPLVCPLATTEPFSVVLDKAAEGKAGLLSGILAIHVLGPLSKSEGLLGVRDAMRKLDGTEVFLYWAAHAVAYASLVGYFLVFARNRLAPLSTNRARPMRVWFLLSLGSGLAIALASFLHEEVDKELLNALVTTETVLFLVFVFASMAFAGEDPVLPRKIRKHVESLRGPRRFLALFEPGAPRGARFVVYACLASQLAVVAVFRSLLATPHALPEIDKIDGIILWGASWSVAFVFFLVGLATLLAWALRHAAASALSILCLAIVLMLYPALWLAFDEPGAPASFYKGYFASPVAVLRSLEDPASETNRRLVMFGPSGEDLISAKQALHGALGEMMQEAHSEEAAIARANALLASSRLDSASQEIVRSKSREAMKRVRSDPRWESWSRPGIFFGATNLGPTQEQLLKEWTVVRDSETAELTRELATHGVPVHVVSTVFFLIAASVFVYVNRRGLARLAAQVAKAEAAS